MSTKVIIVVLTLATLRNNRAMSCSSSCSSSSWFWKQEKKKEKKNTYLESSAPLDDMQAPTVGAAPSLWFKLHKVHKFLPSSFGGANHKPN